MSVRRRAGRLALAGGTAWEDRLVSIFSAASGDGLYTWQRTPHPTRTINGPDGKPVIINAGKGPQDFILMWEGHGVACEAKSSSGPRWSYENLEHHQAIALDDWQSHGGLACLLVSTRETVSGRYGKEVLVRELCLLWREIGPLWWAWYRHTLAVGRAPRGTASVRPEEINSVPVDQGDVWLWFLLRQEEKHR